MKDPAPVPQGLLLCNGKEIKALHQRVGDKDSALEALRKKAAALSETRESLQRRTRRAAEELQQKQGELHKEQQRSERLKAAGSNMAATIERLQRMVRCC